MSTFIIRILPLLLAACTLVSCQTTTAPSALKSGHWRQMVSKTPTYYPNGVPADHPTGCKDGYWVFSGDAEGTRFFIPIRGTEIPTQELIVEAQSTMTPAAKEELARRVRSTSAKDVAGAVTGGTLILLGGIGKAVFYTLAGMDP